MQYLLPTIGVPDSVQYPQWFVRKSPFDFTLRMHIMLNVTFYQISLSSSTTSTLLSNIESN